MNNKALTILISITLALVCALMIITLTAGSTGEKSEGVSLVAKQEDVVSVFGQGKVSLKPDVAYLTMGYENIDMDPKKAQSENAEKMEEIINAIKAAGIDGDHIQTTQYNVSQDYDYNGVQKKILGYRVTNMINIKISEVDMASEIINTAINAGGNVFYGISFDVVERQQAYLDAMDIALERAKEKAQFFAEKEGRTLSGVLEINEGASSSATYRSQAASNYVALSYSRDASAAVEDAIATGQVEITATVTVVYSMR